MEYIKKQRWYLCVKLPTFVKTLVLNQGQFWSHRLLYIWRHFWLRQVGWMLRYLVDGGHGCCHPSLHRTASSDQQTADPKRQSAEVKEPGAKETKPMILKNTGCRNKNRVPSFRLGSSCVPRDGLVDQCLALQKYKIRLVWQVFEPPCSVRTMIHFWESFCYFTGLLKTVFELWS